MIKVIDTFIRGTVCGKPRQTFRAIPMKRNGEYIYRRGSKFPLHTAAAYHDAEVFAECDIWQEVIRKHFRSIMAMPEPLAEPLCVDIEAYFSRPAYLMTAKSPQGAIRFDQKPDRDNIDKAILDAIGTIWKVPDPHKPGECVQRGLWDDDKRVCDGAVQKWYVPRLNPLPGARVIIYRINEAQPALFASKSDEEPVHPSLAMGVVNG